MTSAEQLEHCHSFTANLQFTKSTQYYFCESSDVEVGKLHFTGQPCPIPFKAHWSSPMKGREQKGYVSGFERLVDISTARTTDS